MRQTLQKIPLMHKNMLMNKLMPTTIHGIVIYQLQYQLRHWEWQFHNTDTGLNPYPDPETNQPYSDPNYIWLNPIPNGTVTFPPH